MLHPLVSCLGNLDKCIGKTTCNGRRYRLCTAAPKAGNQARKGTRWMPWRQGPKNDAVGGERTGEGPNTQRAGHVRMGKPGAGHTAPSRAEPIGTGTASRGTETSQYPEEERGSPE